MTKKIAWITDSTAYLTEELKNNPDVFVVPLNIVFGDKEYEDGVDLTTEMLYEKINNEKKVPKTSQPAIGKFAELYEKLKKDYDYGIAVHISGKLSGTLQSSRAGAEMAGFQVACIDSLSMSYAITTLILKGMELSKKAYEFDKIADTLKVEATQSENYILLGNLDQFYKGGRMSGTQYLLGNLLQIKPIIRINQAGEFTLFEKVRSEKKAAKRILELIGKSTEQHNVREIQIMHGNVLSKAQDLEAQITAASPDVNTVIGEISSAIAVHAGEGTLAVIWHKE